MISVICDPEILGSGKSFMWNSERCDYEVLEMTQEEGGQGMCGAREAWIDGEWDWGEWTRSRGGERLSGSFL